MLDFLKKKDAVALPPPPPSVPSGVTPISRLDEKVGAAPVSTPAPKTVASLPPLPKAAAPSSMPLPPSTLPPLNAPPKVLPPTTSMPTKPIAGLPPLAPPKVAASVTSSVTVATPPPISYVSKPLVDPPVVSVKPLSSSTPINSPISAPAKVSMPQVTPPISAKSAQAASSQGQSNLPIAELRKVIEELRNIPLNLPKVEEIPVKPVEVRKPVVSEPVVITPVPARPKTPSEAFIPVARFDESIITIRAIHATVSNVQAGNEKVGSIEGNAHSVANALSSSCESMHVMLLGMDEKLFKVK